MSNKIIHVKDSFKIIDNTNDSNTIIEIVDDLSVIKYDILINDIFITINDTLNVTNMYLNYKNTELIIDDIINISENNYNSDSYILINDIININDSVYCNYTTHYLFYDDLYYTEYWCDSNYVIDGVITFPNMNFIVVNDLIYNTVNIEYYKFTIDDIFNFFIGNKYKNKFSETPMFSEDSLITKTNCIILSDIDGQIINNNIFLSEGLHNLKYKFKNTACQLTLKVLVNNKFYHDNNVLYEYNDNDLYKAKLIRNHIIHSEESKINEDNIILSI